MSTIFLENLKHTLICFNPFTQPTSIYLCGHWFRLGYHHFLLIQYNNLFTFPCAPLLQLIFNHVVWRIFLKYKFDHVSPWIKLLISLSVQPEIASFPLYPHVFCVPDTHTHTTMFSTFCAFIFPLDMLFSLPAVSLSTVYLGTNCPSLSTDNPLSSEDPLIPFC